MSKHYDVIVIGVGAMGSATCYHLAKKGAKVLGLEQFDVPHALGSSHGYSRMIRLAYFNHADYVPMLRQAYMLWQHLENDYGSKIIHMTTGLYLGAPDGKCYAGSLKACIQHNIPHDKLTHAEIAKEFPQFVLPEHYVGLRDLSAGFVLPERAICAHVELALGLGAEIHGREPVTGWKSDGKTVTVTTTRDTYSAGKIVFTGGAWSNRLVADLGVPLKVTRQMLGWVWPSKPAEFKLGKFPCWIIDQPDGENYYGFPMASDNPGFKFAYDRRDDKPSDPDKLQREPTAEDEEHLRPFLKKFIPNADGPLLAIRACMYTNTPDFQFILDQHPSLANVTIACGFSGHGFKFAPVIGQIMSELSLNGKSTLPVEFLGLKRFVKKA